MTSQTAETTVQFDVVDLLISQHMEIRDLFAKVESVTGEARRGAFERLVRLLAVHETVEEQIVHPLTRAAVTGAPTRWRPGSPRSGRRGKSWRS